MSTLERKRPRKRQHRWLMLRDRAFPTEDIYFLVSAVPELKKLGIEVDEIQTRKHWFPWRYARPLPAMYEEANILVCRSLPTVWLQWLIRNKHKLGRIVYLIDDNVKAAAQDKTLPDSYRRRMKHVAQFQPAILALTDEVVASSQHLADTLKTQHSKVSVLTPPLLAPLPGFQHFEAEPSSKKPWQIGFYGTRAHVADLEFIAPAMVALHHQRTDAAFEVMLGQYTPKVLSSLSRCAIPAPLPWNAFREYQCQRRIHVGLAPLLPTEFNAGKSYIKFLDIAAMGGVGIYSNRYPYNEIVEHGVNGMLADDDPNDWLKCMRALLDNPSQTLTMAKNAAQKAADVGHHHHAFEFWHARTS